MDGQKVVGQQFSNARANNQPEEEKKADKKRNLRVTYCGHLVCDNDLAKWALSNQKGSCPACNQPLEGSVRFYF